MINEKDRTQSSVERNNDSEKSWREKTKNLKVQQKFYITKYWWLCIPIYILILYFFYFQYSY